MAGIPIILSTDAAMNAVKQSYFVWTIYSTMELWQGFGAVPGPYKDTHSTGSEAFGILTMLQFLAQYTSRFPLVLADCHPPHNALLQQQRHLTAPNSKKQAPPKITILNNYNVKAEIQQMIAALLPLKINLHHIKGH